MLSLLETSIQPLFQDSKVLDIAYELYLQAPEDSHPLIDLREVSKRTGLSLLTCRNAIIQANKVGRFPNCSLSS